MTAVPERSDRAIMILIRRPVCWHLGLKAESTTLAKLLLEIYRLTRPF